MLGYKTTIGAAGLILLGACSGSTVVNLPQLSVTCPNPVSREALVEGSTYRDLALSRSEAISGWERCHAAMEALQKENPGE